MSDNFVKEKIEKYGWLFQWVFDSEGNAEDFCYSIGFEETFSHPEIMIFGLEKEKSNIILSGIAEDLKAGRSYKPNEKNSEILSGGYEVIFKEVNEDAFPYYLGIATDYYRKPFRAYVMFFPDKNNILPTESGYSSGSQLEALKII